MISGELRCTRKSPVLEPAEHDSTEKANTNKPTNADAFTREEDLILLEFFTKFENKKRYNLIKEITALSSRSPTAAKCRLKRLAKKGVYAIKKKYNVDTSCAKRLTNWY